MVKPISQEKFAARYEYYKTRSVQSYKRLLALYDAFGTSEFTLRNAVEVLRTPRDNVYNTLRQLVGYGIIAKYKVTTGLRKRDHGLRYRIDLSLPVLQKLLSRPKKIPESAIVSVTYRTNGQWSTESFGCFSSVDSWLKRNVMVDVFFLTLDRDYSSLNIATVFELNQILRKNQCHPFNTFFDKVLPAYPKHRTLSTVKHFVNVCEQLGEKIITVNDLNSTLGLHHTQCRSLLESWLLLGWVRPVERADILEPNSKCKYHFQVNWMKRISGADYWHERIDMKGSTLAPISQGDLLWSLGASEFAPFVKRIN